MKILLTISCLFALFSAHGAFAQSKTYFSGQELEAPKVIQLIGAPRTPENIEREDHVGKIVELHENQLRYCFERVLSQEPIGVSATFYFTVNTEGNFGDVTADLNAKDGSDPNVTVLMTCVSRQIQHFHAAKSGTETTFRFRVNFGKP